MLLNDLDRFSKYQYINEGANGIIYKNKKGNAIKVFTGIPYIEEEIQKAYVLDKKLDILMHLKLPNLVMIKRKYYYEDDEYNSKFVWAYEMEYLKQNQLNYALLDYISINQKKEILTKILEILKFIKNYDMYNFDLQLNNFYLSKDNNIVMLDVDNLKISEYDSQQFLLSITEFKEKISSNDELVQNYAFLRLVLEFLCFDYTHLLNLEEIQILIQQLDCDENIKHIAYDILKAQKVDLQELIDTFNSDENYLLKKY